MRILVTSSRMPFALDEIRKLGRRGHTVLAADTFRLAPGNHSALVAESLTVPAPRFAPRRCAERLADAVAEHGVDLLLPTFEEGFCIARHRSRFPSSCRLFLADFHELDRLHNKSRFFGLLEQLGLPAPPTTTVVDQAGLHRAVAKYDRWVARAAYSRGAVDVLTHDGPVAGDLSLDDCAPDEQNPWIVQPFIDGQRLCSFSSVHDGAITAHCTYEHPRTIEGGGGISFRSVEAGQTLQVAERVAAHTGYTGQLSFDLIRSRRGMFAVECNPRATDGVVLMTDEEFDRALLGRPAGEPLLVPTGRRRQISVGLLRELVAHFGRTLARPGALRDALSDLVRVPGVYVDGDDPWPALVLPLSYSHVLGYQLHQRRAARSRSSIMGAYLYDVSWNGEPIP